MSPEICRELTLILVLIFHLMPGSSAVGSEPGPDSAQSSATKVAAGEADPADSNEIPKSGDVTDTQDLEAFFDGVINSHLKSKNIAGGVVAVVAEDRLVFSKGYGYADVEARRKVDPQTTLFRIGSISKLFVWTAVMQLLESGRIELDTDINRYLRNVTIPATYPEPVTMRHLMTHTPGFEDHVIGLFDHDADSCGQLDEVLRRRIPRRVFPAGTIPAYSNFGSSLAAYAVACVSGQTWEDYVEQRILGPLEMNHTLVRQPAKDKLPKELASGYKWTGNEFVPQEFEYIPNAPAGSISMSADDAAKFMIAYLNEGQLQNSRILKSESVRRTREPLLRPDAHAEPLCHGFIVTTMNNQQVVGHNGATIWFHSEMELLPEKRIGIFTSFNTNTASSVNSTIMATFLDRYCAVKKPARPQSIEGFGERVKLIVGEYATTRRSWTSATKISALLEAITISAESNDTIQINFAGHGRRFAEVEPFVYKELDGPLQFVFKQDADGQVRTLFLGNSPVFAAIRVKWYEQSRFHLGLLTLCAVLMGANILYWPVIAYSANGLRAFSPGQAEAKDYWSLIAWLQSLAGIVFLIGLLVLLSDPSEIVFGLPKQIRLLFLVPQIQCGLEILTLMGTFFAWRNGYWKWPARLQYTLVGLAGFIVLGMLYYWNLLSLSIGF